MACETLLRTRAMAPKVFVLGRRCDVAEVFERMAFGGDGIAFRLVHPADDFDRLGLNFDRLPFALGLHEYAGYPDGTACG